MSWSGCSRNCGGGIKRRKRVGYGAGSNFQVTFSLNYYLNAAFGHSYRIRLINTVLILTQNLTKNNRNLVIANVNDKKVIS